jgi:hypothetical protein
MEQETKMDAQLKAKWVKALRSGKYKQARGRLKNPRTGGFCCIGVGMLLIDKKYDLVDGITSNAARRLGLTDDEQSKLVDMNDYDKKTFETIARYIDENL